MLVTFECTVVGQRLKNLSDVRRLQAPKQVRWLAITGSISAGTRDGAACVAASGKHPCN